MRVVVAVAVVATVVWRVAAVMVAMAVAATVAVVATVVWCVAVVVVAMSVAATVAVVAVWLCVGGCGGGCGRSWDRLAYASLGMPVVNMPCLCLAVDWFGLCVDVSTHRVLKRTVPWIRDGAAFLRVHRQQ